MALNTYTAHFCFGLNRKKIRNKLVLHFQELHEDVGQVKYSAPFLKPQRKYRDDCACQQFPH